MTGAVPGATFPEGDRVTLTTLDADDVGFVHEGVNHPRVRRRVGATLDAEREHLEALSDRSDALAVLVVAGDERAGVVELDPIDRERGLADLAVWIHLRVQRSGYGREAVELVVAYGFDDLRLHKVSAHDVNEASCRMLEAVGFTEEGVGREDAFFGGDYHDTRYYGLLARAWRARDDETGGGCDRPA
jgi:RimJ/RimL family protein N-acetyltransferase